MAEADGKDGEILVYEYDKTGSKVEYQRGTIISKPGYVVKKTGHVATRMFWVNSVGIIYSWKWTGY